MKKTILSLAITLLLSVCTFAAAGLPAVQNVPAKKMPLFTKAPVLPASLISSQAAPALNTTSKDNCAYLFMELEDGSIIVVRICW